MHIYINIYLPCLYMCVCLYTYTWVPTSLGSAEIKSLHHHYIFENINRNEWQWRSHPMEFDRKNDGKVIGTFFFSLFILIPLLLARRT